MDANDAGLRFEYPLRRRSSIGAIATPNSIHPTITPLTAIAAFMTCAMVDWRVADPAI